VRILAGTDGSASARQALDLVFSREWPAGSTIQLVMAVPSAGQLMAREYGSMIVAYADDIERQLLAGASGALARAAAVHAQDGLSIETAVLRGRPGDVIANEARQWGADLIVVGHRGLGRIAEMLVGSVATEIVDRATVPVLVARSSGLRAAVLAVDGSPGAAAAASSPILGPLLQAVPLRVVSVFNPPYPWWSGLTSTGGEVAAEAYMESVDAGRAQMEQVARETANGLAEAGFQVSAVLRQGEPANQLIEEARTSGSDLLIVGTRGMTGLSRFVLGSVTRNVLTHAHCSVLVVHEPPHADPVGHEPGGLTPA